MATTHTPASAAGVLLEAIRRQTDAMLAQSRELDMVGAEDLDHALAELADATDALQDSAIRCKQRLAAGKGVLGDAVFDSGEILNDLSECLSDMVADLTPEPEPTPAPELTALLRRNAEPVPEEAPVSPETAPQTNDPETSRPEGQEAAPVAREGQPADIEVAPVEVMAGAARETLPPVELSDRDTLVNRAREMLAGGMSRRAAAEELGVAESTLRRWMQQE